MTNPSPTYEYRFISACGLEHVAHVIRDASRPKTEGEAA